MTVSTACGRWPEELRFPPPVMKSKPFLRVQGATVSTRVARSSQPGSTSLGRCGSWLSPPASEASGSCRNRGDFVWGLGGGFYSPGVSSGFDSAVRFAHVLAQPALFFLKLVEPACECDVSGHGCRSGLLATARHLDGRRCQRQPSGQSSRKITG